MNKEVINDREGIALITLFILGTNSIMASGLSAGRDFWLAILIAIILAIPMMIIYARLNSIYYKKDLFDIIEICFGKILGNTINLLLTLFIFGEINIVLKNFQQFPITVSLPNTPLEIVSLIFMFLCSMVVKKGIKVLGKWGSLVLGVFIITLTLRTILMLDVTDINNIRPVLYNGITPVLKGTFESLMFPFTQTFVFMIAFSSFANKKSPYNIYIKGLLIGGIIIFIGSIGALSIMGIDAIRDLYYPNYSLWLRVRIAGLQRIEIILAALFSLGAFVKISVYLLAACRGVAKVFKLSNYSVIVTPIAVLSVLLADLQFHSIMHYFEWSGEVWYYYAFPFHVIFPICLWVIAEIDINKKKRRYTD